MKSCHVRMEDSDFKRIQDEARENRMSLNGFIVAKILSNLPEKPSQNVQEIHDDLTEILLELTRIKYAIDDINGDESVEILNQNILDFKTEMIKKMMKIQSKISK